MKTALYPLLLVLSPLAGAQVESGGVKDRSATTSPEEGRAQNPPQDQTGDDEGAVEALPTSAEFELALRYRDWMMGIAGNEAVLFSDLSTVIFGDEELRQRADDPDPRVQRDIFEIALSRRVETLLKVQAGKDLGYDPELVAFLTDHNFELKIEGMGGHRRASEIFKAMQVTPEQFKLQIKDSLLERSWEESVTGKAPAGIGRPTVDRFVRPGWVHSAYVNFQGSPIEEKRALIGMHRERVILQVLILDEDDYPDTEQLAVVSRKQYEDGDSTFSYIVRTFGSGGSSENDGFSAPVEVQTLRQVGLARHGTDDLWELARSGKVGQVMGPILLDRGDKRAWCLYRLEERLPATQAGEFLDLDLQQRVTTHLQDAMDRLRGERAFQAVLVDSYIWPNYLRTLLSDPKNRGN